MKTKAIMTVASAQALAELAAQFPVEKGFTSLILPRLGMFGQDKFEGKGKNAVLVQEGGVFYLDHESDEVNEEGKKVWTKDIIEGATIDLIIMYRRKQLSYYDESAEEYTSSPVFDTDDEIVPLFLNKNEVNRGTPAELKKDYKYTGVDGKVKNGLKDNYILYVLYKDEMYQMNLHGSSMYAFITYARKTAVPTVLTTIGSEDKENGAIAWSQMVFTPTRQLTAEETVTVLEKVAEVKGAVTARKAYFAKDSTEVLTPEMAKAIAGF